MSVQVTMVLQAIGRAGRRRPTLQRRARTAGNLFDATGVILNATNAVIAVRNAVAEQFHRPIETFRLALNEEMAVECQTMLRDESRSRWPIRGGRSIKAFYAEYIEGRNVIEILNYVPYAVWLEFSDESPHQGTARDAVDREWLRMTGRAARRAARRAAID